MLPGTDPLTPELSSVDAADTPDLPTRIATLLSQSRAAHLQKKHAAGKANKHGIVTQRPNYSHADACIQDAITYREAAEALDPDHTVPAWAEDEAANKGVSSHALLAHFRAYLTIP